MSDDLQMSDDDLKSIESTDGYDDDDEECWADEHNQENAPARNSVNTSGSSSNWKTLLFQFGCVIILLGVVGILLLVVAAAAIYSRLSGHGPPIPNEISDVCTIEPPCGRDEGLCAVTKVNNYAFCGDVAYLYDNEQGAWKVTMDMSN